MYKSAPPLTPPLLRPHLLQLLMRMLELIRIHLRDDAPLIRLLDKVLVALLERKLDRVFPALETDVRALHEVRGGLPAHEWVLPAVALL